MASVRVIFGTRPEAIKLGPVVAELRALGLRSKVICTDQHRELLQNCPAMLDMEGVPDDFFRLSASVPDGTLTQRGEAIEKALAASWEASPPEIVLVQGDTLSANAAARAAAKASSATLCHVEAGLRSGSDEDPWPEEIYRKEITRLARWHYATSEHNANNLVIDHVQPSQVVLTGSTSASAIARYGKGLGVPEPSGEIIVTLHRRELLESGAFPSVVAAIAAFAACNPGARLLWVMHPHAAKVLGAKLPEVPNLRIVPPLDYRQMLRTLRNSSGVLTDSGGLIEEAAILGIPSVTLRNHTDRPEVVLAGVSELHPPTSAGALAGLNALFSRRVDARPFLGYGSANAAARIAAHVLELARTR